MYEKLDNCPGCGSAAIKNHFIAKDHFLSNESFVICICENCELQFTNPRPIEETISKYYDSTDYISHHNNQKNLFNIIYVFARWLSIKRKISIIKKYQNHGKLLDIGAGSGDFLKHSSEYFKVSGIEVDTNAREIANAKLRFEINSSLMEFTEKQTFQVITMWHVLEHLHDLKGSLSQIRKILRKDGTLFIAVPNINSYDSKFYKNNWAALDVPRHLYHFNSSALKQALKINKLQIIDKIPLWLDAYYISIISRKYVSPNQSLFSALLTGYRSNQLAKKTGDFSSIIYVVQRK